VVSARLMYMCVCLCLWCALVPGTWPPNSTETFAMERLVSCQCNTASPGYNVMSSPAAMSRLANTPAYQAYEFKRLCPGGMLKACS